MSTLRPPVAARRRRLVEELAEIGLDLGGTEPWHELAVAELDYALRPAVHERRVPSYGAFIEPHAETARWESISQLDIELRPVEVATDVARRFSDGVSSWLIRRVDQHDAGAVFDRPAGSERDLVVLAEALGAAVVQRHPSGMVRYVADVGVYRWDGIAWHHEPLVASWIDAVAPPGSDGDREVVETLLEFAVHDLGARNIGATLVYRPAGDQRELIEPRLPVPPPLAVRRPADLAPLRHALAQVDGATLFDAAGVLRKIGVQLVSTPAAEAGVDGYRGMRHTAARRYSFDDPGATVVVVSEDGPVTAFRGGQVLGTSDPRAHPQD